jgi:hypothetical protein
MASVRLNPNHKLLLLCASFQDELAALRPLFLAAQFAGGIGFLLFAHWLRGIVTIQDLAVHRKRLTVENGGH